MRPALISAAALVVALVSAATPEPAPAAALRIIDRDPLSFKGEHFKPGERVRLVVTLKHTTRIHKVHVGAAGTFMTAFAGLVWQRRDGNLTVHATGSHGSHVEFTVLALHSTHSARA
jgi:hypothetical protein